MKIYVLRRAHINVHFKTHKNKVHLLEYAYDENTLSNFITLGKQSVGAWKHPYNVPEYVVYKFEEGEPIYQWSDHPHYRDSLIVIKNTDPILLQPVIVGFLTNKGKLWYAAGCIT